MRKRAGIYGDYAGAVLGGALGDALIPGAGNMADTIGYISGLATAEDGKLDKEVKEMNKSTGMSFIPGVGSHRIVKKMVRNALKNNKKTAWHNILGEQFGPLTSGIPLAIAGGVGGYLIGDNSSGGRYGVPGALLGAAAGMSVPVLVAGALALINKRRSGAEQREHDKDTHIENWLIPGVGQYNALKRFGRIRGEEIGEK